jgi:ferric-dicitrate binding protein FerR (iron transport regulator)
VAEIKLRLSKREADALSQDWGRWRKSSARRSAEFKLREAIWAAYPDLRDVDYRRAEQRAHDDERHREMRKSMGLR